jgi:copper chaperone
MATLQLTVPDMACGACATTISQAIEALDPGAQVQADPAHKTVQVVTSAALAAVRSAIEQAGYHPAAD